MTDSQDSVAALLACPFCGKSDLDQWPNDWLDNSGANVIRCTWCHGAAPEKTWNKRAAIAALQAQQGDRERLDWVLGRMTEKQLNEILGGSYRVILTVTCARSAIEHAMNKDAAPPSAGSAESARKESGDA